MKWMIVSLFLILLLGGGAVTLAKSKVSFSSWQNRTLDGVNNAQAINDEFEVTLENELPRIAKKKEEEIERLKETLSFTVQKKLNEKFNIYQKRINRTNHELQKEFAEDIRHYQSTKIQYELNQIEGELDQIWEEATKRYN